MKGISNHSFWNKGLLRRARTFGLSLLALAALASPSWGACGPGAHWVDTCASGAETFPLSAAITTSLGGDPLKFNGTATVFLGGPSDTPDPLDPGHQNRIEMEVVSLSLTEATGSGIGIQGGDGTGNLSSDDPLLFSPGSVTETDGNPATATFVFDVLLQLEALGTTLHNVVPLHVEAVVGRIPPVFTVTNNTPIPLLDSNDQPSQITLTGATITAGTAPVLPPNSVVNGASFRPATDPNGAVAPGSIVSLFGVDLASSSASASAVPLPTSLDGTSITFNSTAAPLFVVSGGQINAQVPFGLQSGDATVQVTRSGVTSAAQTVTVAAVSPGIFTLNAQGTGQGAILLANTPILAAPSGSVPGREAQPIQRGQFLSIFCSGLGEVMNPPPSGAAGAGEVTILTPTVTIGGVDAPVSFSGLGPGFVGLYQVNVPVPANAPTGDAVELVITIGNVVSNTVTIAVQ